MNFLDKFRSNNTEVIKNLQDEVTTLKFSLEEKSNSLNNSLAAVVGNSLQFYNVDKESSYNSHYTIYRGIDMLAECIAQLPVQIYKGDNLLPYNTALPNGFNPYCPNPSLSLNEVIYAACIYYFYRGEFMVHIKTEPFFHLVPINPKNIKLQKNGVWLYKVGNHKETILPENLIYCKLFNPDSHDDIYSSRGLSPIDVVKDELINDTTASNYNTQFFKNFGQVGGTLEDTTGRVSKEDMKQLVAAFNNKPAGTIVGLQKGVAYKESAQTMLEMQFLESRRDIRDKILAVLGIHKALFGITDEVNRSVAEEATRQLWIFNLKPKAIRIQEKINQTLMRNFFPGYQFCFDFSQITELQESTESVLVQAKALRDLGYTTNEINDYFDLGMPTIEDEIGNMRLVPSGYVPASDFSLTLPPLVSPAQEPAPKDASTEEAAKQFLGLFETKADKTIDLAAKSFVARNDRLVKRHERLLFTKLKKHLSEQGRNISSLLSNRKSVNHIITKEDLSSIIAELQNYLYQDKALLSKLVEPIYIDMIKEADKLAIDNISADGEASLRVSILNKAINRIKSINNATYIKVKEQIKNGLADGASIDDISKRIKKVYAFSPNRAKIVAQTETQSVVNEASFTRYTENGVEKKQWISTSDEKTRPSHIAINGEIVGMDEVFSNGLSCPGHSSGPPEEIINCRCCIAPVIE